jgi:hypothetical protein
MEAHLEEDLVHERLTFKKYVFDESEILPKHHEIVGLAVAANIICSSNHYPYQLIF